MRPGVPGGDERDGLNGFVRTVRRGDVQHRRHLRPGVLLRMPHRPGAAPHGPDGVPRVGTGSKTRCMPPIYPLYASRHINHRIVSPRCLSQTTLCDVAVGIISTLALIQGARRVPTTPSPVRRRALTAPWQGRTLVHFSAQPEPFLTQNTPYTPPKNPCRP